MASPIQASAAALDTAISTLHRAVRTYIEACAAGHKAHRQVHGRSHGRFDATTDYVRELLLGDDLFAQIVGRNPSSPIANLATIHAPDA
jgi:hypothetical protein